MKKFYQNKPSQKKILTSKELQVLRLSYFNKFFQKTSENKTVKYFSIKRMREVLITLDKRDIEGDWEHKDIGNPTERQVLEIHHEVFKGSKSKVTEKILEDYFMQEGITIDNFSGGKHVNRITKLLREQGIELKEDTVRRKIKAYQKDLSFIEIRSDFKKQRMEYRSLINLTKTSHAKGSLERDLPYLNLMNKILSNVDKLGSQALGQIKAREEAIGFEEEEIPDFKN